MIIPASPPRPPSRPMSPSDLTLVFAFSLITDHLSLITHHSPEATHHDRLNLLLYVS